MAKDESQIYLCTVEKVYDGNDGLRIKARIPYYDYNKTVDELPYAFPLLPKFLHVNPKEGECVLVITQDCGNPASDRFFVGPLISQPYMLPYEREKSAKKLLNGASMEAPYPAVNMDPGNDGVLPNRNDIAIMGRENAEIVLKDEEIRLRCGYKKSPLNNKVVERLHRNDINPAYIQMKFGIIPEDVKESRFPPVNTSKTNGYCDSSLINIVADRINLLTHDSATNFELNDKNELITYDELEKIFKEAHPLPYGDVLADYLKLLVDIFRTHTHTFAYKTPQFTKIEEQELDKFDDLYRSMLSKNILIN